MEGYDSDGLLPDHPNKEDDLAQLEDYNDIPIGRELEGNDEAIAHRGGGMNEEVEVNGGVDGDVVSTKFVLLSDDDISKLKVDGLRK